MTGQATRPTSVRSVAVVALAVCAAYFVGANVGFLLRIPPTVPSVLWPPNAILTAALLVTPARHWWIYLLAALPAHLAAELGTAWPLAMVLGLFVTNCSEALIGAGCVRTFSDAPTRFDTLGRVAVFVMGAAIVGPFVSSFLDAGVVSTLASEPYWLVWRTRFFSNMLTELVLVPTAVILVTSFRSWVRRVSLRRRLEAVLLTLALLAAGMIYIAAREDGAGLGVSATPLVFFLPFVFWGAVRFGPAGASVLLFITALIVIWAETHGHGTLAMLPRAENVLSLQLTLGVAAIPLLCLAGLIAERRRAQESLAERLRFEEVLSRLSGDFVHLASDRMGDAFASGLERLGQALALDQALLLRVSEDGQRFAVAHSWAAPGVPPDPRPIVSHDVPWTLARLLRGQPVVLSRLDDLPDEAPRDRESLRQRGLKSRLALPLVSGGPVLGGLVLESFAGERVWPAEQVGRLQLVAEVFANALARKESEDAVRGSELMKSAILASLNSSVAVLDHDGVIVAVNQAWARFLPHGAAPGPSELGLGANYLDVYRRPAEPGLLHAGEALKGIQSVLDGSRALYDLEYSCRYPAGERWYAMSVVPLHRPEGGAVVSHTDVTGQKQAAIEARRSLQELAHFARVSTMGELTASLAHELNQPLTGILTNARAAQRLLRVTPPDLDEVRAILGDIADDDKRAADVIQRLRNLLRKSDSVRSHLDLNVMVLDVVKLLGSDTIIRNVAVTLDLDERPVAVSGDRVQLEQVILNLMLNGMEAMADCGSEARTLTVRTTNGAQGVEVAVADTGPGLPDGIRDRVFEPFYTTKAAGMGMGLAIVRSIIEAHHGQVWAEDLSPNGAVFRFRLPVAGDGA